jgi:predicted metalloprotease with PDZ domain
VTQVHSRGANAGGNIYPQDMLMAVGGRRLLADGTKEWLAAQPAGSSLPLHLFRRDRLMETELKLGQPTGETVTIVPIETPTEAAAALRKRWLGL